MAAACLAIGFLIFLGWLPRLALSLSILIALAFWPAARTRASRAGAPAAAAAASRPPQEAREAAGIDPA